jgi:hypothetical protein
LNWIIILFLRNKFVWIFTYRPNSINKA